MRILLIEDDKDIALNLKDQLSNWFLIEVAFTAEDAENLALISPYDLFIIDITLPDKSGLVLCETLRKNGIKSPILILTGHSEIEIKVQALNQGCDDFVTKPFNFDELLARIRALLRRTTQKVTSNILRTGELALNTESKIVTRQNQIITLRKKELFILEYLMRNAGRVLSRDMILENVWETSNDTVANVVDVHIKHLREKIDRPFSKKMIKTIHGLGYRLEP